LDALEREQLLDVIDGLTSDTPWSHTRVCHLLFDVALTFERPRVLEVAASFGKATVYLAAAARESDGRVYAVDQFQPEWKGQTVTDLLRIVGVAEWCDLTIGKDARWYLIELLTANPGEWIDLAYVDASHSVEVDSFVALAAWVHLKPGGVLVLDDLDWIAQKHGPADWPFSRPSVAHVRAIYDYLRGLPAVDEAVEWGASEVGWAWGLIRKRSAQVKEGHGIADLCARLPSLRIHT
jgi:predicted O-methyltransferase YrrM